MIFYFTGTGNSMWAAKELGKALGHPVESILRYRKEAAVSISDTVAGFVFPTYMGDLPWIVKEFLLKLAVSSDAYCFVVMTSNHGESGKAFQSMDQALAVHGAFLSAGFDLQMPGNCLISSEEENAGRLRKAPEHLAEIAGHVKERTVNYSPDGSRAGKGFVERSYFYGNHSLKRLTLMKNFQVTDACTKCGICAKICPMENIVIREKKAVHGRQCAACYACLHWCPEHATLLRVPTLKHRSQYRHPDITLSELIKAKEAP